jgi:hypothetical protein
MYGIDFLLFGEWIIYGDMEHRAMEEDIGVKL